MSYQNTWETHGLYRKFSDEIRADEILESNFELHRHPNFEDITYIINDFTKVTDSSVETAHTKTFAKIDDIISKTKGHLKIAIVVV